MANGYILREDAVGAVEFGITLASAINIETGERTELFQRENDELREAVKRIKDIKPADVAPVVRCKNCEHWQTDWNPSIPDRHYCAVMDSMMKADDFCSYGERREDIT